VGPPPRLPFQPYPPAAPTPPLCINGGSNENELHLLMTHWLVTRCESFAFTNDQRVSNVCHGRALSLQGFVCHCVCLIPFCLLYILGTQWLGVSLYLRGFQAGLINKANQCKAFCNAIYVMHTMAQGFRFSFYAHFVL